MGRLPSDRPCRMLCPEPEHVKRGPAQRPHFFSGKWGQCREFTEPRQCSDVCAGAPPLALPPSGQACAHSSAWTLLQQAHWVRHHSLSPHCWLLPPASQSLRGL